MLERAVGLLGGGHSRAGKRHKKFECPQIERVDLTDIDRSDELFSVNFEPDLSQLRESVKQVEILEPIWLRGKGRKFQIISGFRRFDVAHTLGKKTISALIWKEGKIDDRLAFEMSLHGNILGRGLNLVEKGLVLEKLLIRFSVRREEVIQTFLPLLNLEPNEKVLNGLLLINTFSTDLKRYFLSQGVSLKNILFLAEFSGEERQWIYRLLSPLRVGENVLREILTFLREISHRDGIRINDLISSRKIQDLLSDEHLSGPQKIEAVRRLLRKKRYPRLSELEDRFRSFRKRMRLTPRVAITPPPFFEGNRFRIEFSFESLQEYEAILGELQNLSKEAIGNLLTIKGYGSDTL